MKRQSELLQLPEIVLRKFSSQMVAQMELKMRSEWPDFTPINIKFYQPIVPITAILALR